MSPPACPKCGKPMKLLDEAKSRYYCYSDDVVYVGSKNRWSGLEHVKNAQESSASAASPGKTKSLGKALILNFLIAGAGLIYAGRWPFGIAYLVAVLFFLLVPPLRPIAFIIVIVSYIHTYVAIEDYNTKSKASSQRPTVNPQIRACSTCGYENESTASLCVRCGTPITRQHVPDTTRIWETAANTTSTFCMNCGNKLPAESKFCNKCGTAQP